MARGDIYDVDKVRHLSQDKGLNDRQIAEVLGCYRSTITRLRKRHNIPRCDIGNRHDKSYICAECGDLVFIRRKDRRKALCSTCENSKKHIGC